jgi:hypothetical protein
MMAYQKRPTWLAILVFAMVITACGEQAQEPMAQESSVHEQATVSAPPRETFNGYLAYPEDMEEMQARIDERDLHGATQAYLWSMAMAPMFLWEASNLKVGDHLDLVTYVTPEEKRDILTANATTPYAVGAADLTKTGGMVEIVLPAGPVGGLVNDGQMRHVVDFGLAGPDQGAGGKYLILGPGVSEPEDHDADYVYRSKSNLLITGMRVLAGDEAERQRIFESYKMSAPGEPSPTRVISIGDAEYRTYNARGMDYWVELHEHMQREHFGPEDAMALQFLKRLGIEQGKPFEPDERQTRVLLEAEKIGFYQSVAMAAAREMDDGLKHTTFYDDTNWTNPLAVTAVYTHINESGVMELDLRTSWAHEAITMSEGMTAETTGVGSKYLAAYRDSDGNYINSSYNYELVVPANPPAEQFWSLTAYNANTRSMVYTDRKDVSSRHDIHVNEDGSVPVFMSSECENMRYPQNCIKIDDQGDVFVYFRVYAPTQDYFDKNWTLPNIQRIE